MSLITVHYRPVDLGKESANLPSVCSLATLCYYRRAPRGVRLERFVGVLRSIHLLCTCVLQPAIFRTIGVYTRYQNLHANPLAPCSHRKVLPVK